MRAVSSGAVCRCLARRIADGKQTRDRGFRPPSAIRAPLQNEVASPFVVRRRQALTKKTCSCRVAARRRAGAEEAFAKGPMRVDVAHQAMRTKRPDAGQPPLPSAIAKTRRDSGLLHESVLARRTGRRGQGARALPGGRSYGLVTGCPIEAVRAAGGQQEQRHDSSAEAHLLTLLFTQADQGWHVDDQSILRPLAGGSLLARAVSSAGVVHAQRHWRRPHCYLARKSWCAPRVS